MHQEKRYRFSEHCAVWEINKDTCVWLHGKCASTTIKSHLCLEKNKKQIPRRNLENEQRVRGYKNNIIIVRNPFDRLVSVYHNKVLTSREEKGGFRGHNNLHENTSFREFIKYVTNPETIVDNHWSRYCDNVVIGGDFIPNKIFKTENLNEFWKFIKVKPPSKKMNASSGRGNYKEYYDSKTRGLVEQFYKCDLDRFGYKY